MSRKQLDPPADPLAAKLFAKKNGRAIEELTDALNKAGCPVSAATVKNWLQGRRAPQPLIRPMLAAALKNI